MIRWRRTPAGLNTSDGGGEAIRGLASVEAFKQAIDQIRYRAFRSRTANDSSGRGVGALNTNEQYWDMVRRDRLTLGARVRLAGFYLTEWVPLAPGQFYSPEAAWMRDLARDHIYSVDTVRGVDYLPQGKVSMIQGGIGTFRLPPLELPGGPVHVLGATSDGICHSGIPIVLNSEQYGAVIPDIREHGGTIVDISGIMRVIPEVVRHHTHRLVLEAIDIQPQKKVVPSTSVEATACIAFYTKKSPTELPFPDAFSFITFRPGMADALDAAVRWLESYACRFSEGHSPLIVGDFDAYHDHFPNVELPLKNIMRGVLDLQDLKRRHPALMSEIHINGDVFSNVVNSQIVNRSTAQSATSLDEDEC
jgi:hypothetical protein